MRDKNRKRPALDYIFHPETIAIAGVSVSAEGPGVGRNFITRFVDAGFKGKIYPLNPAGGEIDGLKVYKNIGDIPGPVDYVVSAIPAKHTPQLINECADKGVKLVHLFSAGFSEVGSEEGKRLEAEITAIARDRGIRLTGPNGMGIYCPESGLCFDVGFPRESGTVGWLAQSGRNSTYMVRECSSRGVYFSKVISYGNGVDLTESDFIDYFREDPDTEIIAAYIEGVRDGRRFFKVLKEVARVKPVIIMKAGTTEAGSRAVASHTAAIAGSEKVWSAALKQAGAIQVNSMEEMSDMLVLFRFMSRPAGNNISIIGFGGGAGVQATDSCINAGIEVPLASGELQRELKEVCGSEAGSIFKNPFDLWPRAGARGIERAIELIVGWEKTDLLLVHLQFDLNPQTRGRLVEPYRDTLIKLAPEIRHKTAVVLDFIIYPEAKQLAMKTQQNLAQAGFPVFHSTGRVAAALSKFIWYHRKR
jgi:acyl-CoA synthetase (NDP forming)